ncbi:MAG: uroporphyrinogen-III synthase [Desulfobacterales bacterium]
MGAEIDEIPVYHTVNDTDNITLIRDLETNSVDLITFTSSSTVTNFKALLPPDRFDALTKNVTIASIGPITSETVSKNGFTVHIEAAAYTIPGLCEAIVSYFQ